MNKRELDVLSILWSSDEPMMATDIVDEKLELHQSTVTAVLRKLLNEDLVEVVGVTHSGRVLSRTYRPTPQSRDVILRYFLDCYKRFEDVIDASALCAAILFEDKPEDRAREQATLLMKQLESQFKDISNTEE